MHVIYTIEHGFTMLDTVLTVPELKPYLQQWGEVALHYMAMFSWRHSLHYAIDDYVARDEAVISEMQARKLGKGLSAASTKLNYPFGLYKEPTYGEAAAALLRLKFLPEMEHYDFLSKQLKVQQAAMGTIELETTNPDKMSKQITAMSALQKLINETAKEMEAITTRFDKRVSRGGVISHDELWKEV